MNCKSLIPSGAFSVTLSKDTKSELDTKGANMLIKALTGSVSITLRPWDSQEQAYTLSEGETMTFCGKLYLSGNGSVVTGMMFTTL